MTSFAIVGVADALGRAVAARLDADPDVDRVVGIDVRAPQMPPATLTFVRADQRDPLLGRLLEGVDVLVHVGAAAAGGEADGAARARALGQCLASARAAGVGTIVYVSSALVYGAEETNPVPLTEHDPARAGTRYPPADAALRAEQAVLDLAARDRGVRVAVLRPVTVLGSGVDTTVTRHLESPLLPMVRGCDPPVQFVDVDDLAAAVRVVATRPSARGIYNVAADGWLTTSDVERLLARPALHLPRETAVGLAGALHRVGLLTAPPGALDYLMHPWVVDTARLRALGWHPAAGQREILHRFVAEHGPWLSVGRIRLRTTRLVLAALAGGGVLGAAALWVTWRLVRARTDGPRRSRARRPTRRRRGRSSARGSS